jgi:hypothetical protein
MSEISPSPPASRPTISVCSVASICSPVTLQDAPEIPPVMAPGGRAGRAGEEPKTALLISRRMSASNMQKLMAAAIIENDVARTPPQLARRSVPPPAGVRRARTAMPDKVLRAASAQAFIPRLA